MKTESISVADFIRSNLDTPLIVFGGLTGIKFAEKHGWDEVWCCLARMYGMMPSFKDTERLDWMIGRSQLAVWVDDGSLTTLNCVKDPRKYIDAVMKDEN